MANLYLIEDNIWVKTFPQVSQSLPNPEFVSILGKKLIFSKRHPYSNSILVFLVFNYYVKGCLITL